MPGPSEFITAYDEVQHSPVAWMFAGTILVGAIGSLFNDAQYVQNPQKSGCCETKLEKDEHTLYKVAKMQEEWAFGIEELFQRSFTEKAIPLSKKKNSGNV